jgi:hypothetical protein
MTGLEITYFTPVIPIPEWFAAAAAAGPIEPHTRPPRLRPSGSGTPFEANRTATAGSARRDGDGCVPQAA